MCRKRNLSVLMKLGRTLTTLTLVQAAYLGLSISSQAAGPGNTNDFGGRRVLFVGIDGVRPDALQVASTPNMDALAANGVITYNAFAGGVLGTATQQVTYSGPGWSSLLTGVWTNKHGVTNNSFTGQNFQNYPHFFRRVKEEVPTAFVSSIVHWSPIDTSIVEGSKLAGVEYADYRNIQGSDAGVASTAVTQLGLTDPDVMFLHFDDVDHAGHAYGYSTTVPQYVAAIEQVDTHIGTVLAALQSRAQYAQEDWLIIVSTDHGGTGTGHGGQSTAERTIFMLVSGGATENGVVSNKTPGQPAVPATAMKHLGIAVAPSWGWEEPAFGLPAPEFFAESAGHFAVMHWSLPQAGLDGLTGFEILRDDVSIATLGADARNYSDAPSLPLNGSGQYSYSIRFLGTTESQLTAQVVLGSGDASSDLEMHLTFDEVTTDETGNGHDASAVGTPAYVDGVSGKAVLLDGSHHFTVPQTGGLLFGADTDFTVGFWVKTSGQWSGDPSFISNKDWDSGANQGWIVAGEANGPDWQWNFKGASTTRKDFDNGGLVQDGKWHHILVSHDRDGNATFYQDGVLIASVSIAGTGSCDTAFPIAIGRDGELDYSFSQPVYMDEVKIWRRALSAADVQTEVAGRSDYFSWMEIHFSELQLGDPAISASDADPDEDGMSNAMEYAFGKDPLVADVVPVLDIHQEGDDWVVSWPQKNGGSGVIGQNYTVAGVSYVLESSEALGSWLSGSGVIEPHGIPSYLAPGWHRASARLVNPPEEGAAFFRLHIAN